MNSNELATTKTAVEKLNRSLGKSTLDDLVKARTRRSLLLVDCSGSMADRIASGERRIDALRKRVELLRETHPVPVAAFGVRCAGQVEVVDTIPEPQGSTPLDLAIDFAMAQGATHLVVITDGEPNDEASALASARIFGGVIDVFFIGDEGSYGAAFCKRLAAASGGTCGVTDLGGSPKVLAGAIRLALGDGTETI